jgi:hypothetical protein
MPGDWRPDTTQSRLQIQLLLGSEMNTLHLHMLGCWQFQ